MISRYAIPDSQKSHFCRREKMSVFSPQMFSAHFGGPRKPRGGRFFASGANPFNGPQHFLGGCRDHHAVGMMRSRSKTTDDLAGSSEWSHMPRYYDLVRMHGAHADSRTRFRGDQ